MGTVGVAVVGVGAVLVGAVAVVLVGAATLTVANGVLLVVDVGKGDCCCSLGLSISTMVLVAVRGVTTGLLLVNRSNVVCPFLAPKEDASGV